MHVLVATDKTQGKRKSDFNWVPNGELVTPGFECDSDKRTGPDGGCGCRRSLVGVLCNTGTTTFEVVERKDLTPATLKSVYRDRIEKAWGPLFDDPEELDEWAQVDLDEMTRTAEFFGVGAVIEKRGERFKERVVQ